MNYFTVRVRGLQLSSRDVAAVLQMNVGCGLEREDLETPPS